MNAKSALVALIVSTSSAALVGCAQPAPDEAGVETTTQELETQDLEGDDARVARMQARVDARVAEVLDSIDATEVQRAAVQDAKERLRERALELRADGREARATGLAELRKDEPDGKVLHGLVDQRAEAITAVAHDVVEAVLAIHQELDPEQRKLLLDRAEAAMRRFRR